MPRRKYLIATNQVYHVFNRSIAGEEVFTSKRHFLRAMELTDYYRYPQDLRYSQYRLLPLHQKRRYLEEMKKNPPYIILYCFALMPNHYHFLAKQKQDQGLRLFISNFQNSFAKYYNLKINRHGGLFQHPFKAKRVETDEEFIHISRYIHLNPVTSFLIEFNELITYPWTSFPHYLTESKSSLVDIQELLEMFKSGKDYAKFVADQVDYQRQIHLIKNLTIE